MAEVMPVCERKAFKPFEGEGQIVLKQVHAKDQANAGDACSFLSISAPDGAVMVGVVQSRLSFDKHDPASAVVLGGWFFALVLVLCAGAAVVRRIWDGDIKVEDVVRDPGEGGKASLSRFQALLFTFVFLISFILVVAGTGQFPEKIPQEILFILAGSLGTYLASKYIGKGAGGQGGAVGTGLNRVVWCGGAPASSLPLALNPAVPVSRVNLAGQNPAMSPVSFAVPWGGPLNAKDTDSPYMVVAVLVGKVKLQITQMSPFREDRKVWVRVGGAAPVSLRDPMPISSDDEAVTEVSVAVFGETDGDAVRIEIAKSL